LPLRLRLRLRGSVLRSARRTAARSRRALRGRARAPRHVRALAPAPARFVFERGRRRGQAQGQGA